MDIEELRQLMEDQLRLSRRLKARVRELDEAQHAPLAVVGMALRLPGGLTTPEAYWNFLRSDASVLSEIPDERPGLHAVYDPQQDKPGHSYVRHASFLADIAHFDPAFFGISQREAEALDPQQRLLLETAWEAMERAGIAVRRQDRLSAGVFVGIMASEYGERVAGHADKTGIDPYFGTGGGHSFAAGRISYVMGLSGPALSVDTACSSSLVALHLGVQSLRRGECRYALVGGSNLILSADLMVSLCQTKALAPDGRSKPFSAAADGYGRGEGAGILVLMRLEDALREDRPILAVVRGTAVNHDGASSGLTVPNGPAQQEVIREALADGRVAPEEVGCVEAHGTGTSLGDPIEVGALDAVVGSGARGRTSPVVVGSVKARIGHLEAAAGVAGLIKVVLMLGNGEIPATIDGADGGLNPLIPWDRIAMTVPDRVTPWPAGHQRRVAGISAFGLSGTNAHAVLEAYQPPAAAPVPPRNELLTLSARDATALQELARAVRTYLARADQGALSSVCHTLRAGRVPFAHRVAVTGRTPSEISDALDRALDGEPAAPTPTVMMVGLKVGADSTDGAAAAKGIAAITDAFPQLGTVLDGVEAPSAALLERMLRGLGVRVRVSTDAALADGAARLEWGDQACPLLDGDPDAAPDLLLDALAALFVAGVDVRLELLRAPGVRIVGDLPTYAFQRRRCWIDERPAEGGAPVAAESGGTDTAAALEALAEGNVDEFLLEELKSVLHAEGEIDPAQSFLELGGDSFTALMFTTNVENQFGIIVPPDEFAIDLPISVLLGRLSDHIVTAVRDVEQEQSA